MLFRKLVSIYFRIDVYAKHKLSESWCLTINYCFIFDTFPKIGVYFVNYLSYAMHKKS